MVEIYQILHVAAGFLLTALTFAACAAPDPEKRKRSLMLTGILSLVMLVGGFGLVARVYDNQWESWVFVKIACWLGLSAIAGIAYRKPDKGRGLMLITTTFVLLAVGTVYLKPDLTPSADAVEPATEEDEAKGDEAAASEGAAPGEASSDEK